MFRTQLMLLVPSIFFHLFFSMFLAVGAWFALSKVDSRIRFQWRLPLLVGGVLSVYLSVNGLFGIYQSGVLARDQQQHQAEGPQTQAQNVDPKIQAKQEFLNVVQQLADNPSQLTPETKKRVFDHFSALFTKGEDRKTYEAQIFTAFNCQRYFFEDALASYQSKKSIKSEAREKCEASKGTFFNRDRLIPEEIIKTNDKVIGDLAARKRVPASRDENAPALNEELLRKALDDQVRRTDALKKVFE